MSYLWGNTTKGEKMTLNEKHRLQLAEYLRGLRLAKDISQGAVATELGYSSPQYISNIERGLCATSLNQLAKFRKIYGVPKAEFTKEILAIYQRNLEGAL